MNVARFQDPATMRNVLRAAHTIAVVGLSSKPHRPSFGVAAYLQRQGYRIIPVNPNEREVLGEPAYANLRDIPEHVDIVDVFRTADALPDVARDAVAIGADVLWTQFDVVNAEGARIAQAAGMTVVMDRCIKIEHAARAA
jgi:predicted CoA-binding protein